MSEEVPDAQDAHEDDEIIGVAFRRSLAVIAGVGAVVGVIAAMGGDEPEPLAFGAINLRQLYEGRRDMQSQQVQLLTDDGEVTTLTVSTSVVATLERVMQPRR